jgi:anti-sigma factor RsiW
MNAARHCDKILLAQAELDGELDAAEAAALAVHRADCPFCQAASAQLARAGSLLDREQLYQPMPAEVRARVMARFGPAPAERPAADPPPSRLPSALLRWWQWGAGFGLGAACAAALAFLVVLPQAPGLTDEIVASHIRALQPGHLEDVPSTDQHTVKPWFDGRIDFAPPVKNLEQERFPLKGGRLDYVGGRPVAALVYQRDKHLIDLYVWPAAGPARAPEAAERQGYNVVQWTENGMSLWAVSDLEVSQLREFAEDWRRSP